MEHSVEYTDSGPIIRYNDEEGNDITPQPLYTPQEDLKIKKKKKVVAVSTPGEPSPIMATFLKMATSTVYKMAGLGSFQGSHTYKSVMGEFEEEEEKDEEDGEMNLDEATEDLGDMQDKGSVSLTESPTFWQISIAGTCVALPKTEEVSEKIPKSLSLDLTERWTQTLDLPRKRKETQSEQIVMKDSSGQASNIDIFKALKSVE
ncbi:uncharacterized protein LOC111696231 [Eurytemora carolleeae]|uniref:uncharacterized protein LOC111696231 n=1 Tax=Eurytemora carolleeae TaxID=1294199 RepID=UPI000C7805E3|nr:uncharacterized protein LOC111696231 [Eurytemora carolleeae]|eukprot:XP_023321545.1 uncharacterized protein LOC111696231 [Eurytemora affinis]